MAEHKFVKAEKILALGIEGLKQQLVLPSVFRKEGIDKFVGAKGDTYNIKVKGILPYRTYGWRNDRSTEIVFDEYEERTVPVRFGDDIYSAVRLTDEQAYMDTDGWADIALAQANAVGRGVSERCIRQVINAPYEVEIGLTEYNASTNPNGLRAGLIKARAVMNRLQIPQEQRWLLVGTDVESALLLDPTLNFAQNAGDNEAEKSITTATIGARYGFKVVVVQELPPKMAVAMVQSAFVCMTGAPPVPASVPWGASASSDGWAMRWIRDYDSTRFQDRSIFNTWFTTRYVPDVLVGHNPDTGTGRQGFVSNYEHFVRAIKLTLGGTDNLPDPDGDDEIATELGNITGIWKTGDGTKSADQATIQTSTVKKNDNTTANTPTTQAKARDEA